MKIMGLECPNTSTLRKCYKSFWSAGSVLSLLSVFCIISCASIGSIFSIGSILSVGSIGSVLSIASYGSVLSMFSTNCHYKFFTDCRREPESEGVVRLRFPDASWQNMLACNYTGYRADPRDPNCDYQPVTVSIALQAQEIEVQCEARRKGSSTWKDVDAKPSFKVKCDDRMELGTHNCSGVEQCPGGGATNRWYSKKFILNNGGAGTDGMASHAIWYHNAYFTWGEVDFYIMFRKIGGLAWPFAKWVDVQVMHENTEINLSQYVFLENVDDKDFGKKWFGQTGWALWEVEGGRGGFQRDYGTFECDELHCLVNGSTFHLPDFAYMSMNAFSQTTKGRDAMLTYYMAEQLGGKQDAVCSRYQQIGAHNHYIAANDSGWYIIPHGADATYQPCEAITSVHPKCKFIEECKARNHTCADRLDVISKRAKQHAHRIIPSCIEEATDAIVYASVGLGVPLVAALLLIWITAHTKERTILARSNPSRNHWVTYTKLATTDKRVDPPQAFTSL